MNAYAKRNYFLWMIRSSVKGNKQAKNYLTDYYTNRMPITFFDNFSLETIEKWDVKKQVLEVQEIINAN
jgi:hypothetical protein